jgi:hypothetical protein|tara:strand:+ start:56 stop:277 length:222 start_codon:yes stop_codon:yes gene_type:complete
MGKATPVLYRGRKFDLNTPGAAHLMKMAVRKRDEGFEVTARRLVSLAVRIEAGLITSGEAFDAADVLRDRVRC